VTPTFGLAVDCDEPSELLLARVRELDAGSAFTRLWVADERFRRDVWVTLGLLAAETGRLELATCVTDPFIRHPALTATAIATVDEASGGRAILGLGAGVSGFGALGIDRTAPATALREAIELARRLWASSDAFTYEGRQTSFRDARLGFAPTRRIPIMLAGRGPKILELAGEVADGVMVATFVGGPLLAHSLARVEAGVARRDPALGRLERISWAYVSIDDDREAARRAARRGIAVALWGSRPILDELGVQLPAELIRVMDEGAYSLDPEVIGRAAALVPETLVDECSISGTPDECVRKLVDLAGQGFDHVACWLFPTPSTPAGEMVSVLETRVIPAVRVAA